jgi:hypothetical protein
MEVFLDVATRFGVPTAILIVVFVYHARVVKDHAALIKEKDVELARILGVKDAELARVNELRVKESQEVADRMIVRDAKYIEVLGEVDKTLTLISQRVK